MKVYILDRRSKTRKQIFEWLSNDLTVVEAFEDYIKFIEQIESSPPDLCFIRLDWDEMPGLKIADMVRQISSGIRVVFISDDKDYAIDAYEVGAYGYLLCPLTKVKLEKYLMMKKEM